MNKNLIRTKFVFVEKLSYLIVYFIPPVAMYRYRIGIICFIIDVYSPCLHRFKIVEPNLL